jgi:manganese transport protein
MDQADDWINQLMYSRVSGFFFGSRFESSTRSLKKFLACTGPGYLVAVGYMDPGNWVTDLAGGSKYGYTLLSVIFLSNLMAIILQYCALKLGIVTGKDLARACRDYYAPYQAYFLWILAEIAVIATDLAEVIGSAIALQLLFGIPLFWGVLLTTTDVLLLLAFAHRHARNVQLLVTLLIAGILGCFSIIIYLAQPHWVAVLAGFVPSAAIITEPDMLYVAIGILGATVMPHNLYLHSYLVSTTDSVLSDDEKNERMYYSTVDLCVALTFAFFVNAAILIVAGALFFQHGLYHVSEIQDAYYLFTPLLKTPTASFVFAIALLISGQNSTLTGTLAGQIIMDGFLHIRLPAWQRRLIGRIITVLPALIGIYFFGQHCLSQMMIASQIILSLQLPFALFPLIHFTSSATIMGQFTNGFWVKSAALASGILIVILNFLLLYFLYTS